MRYMIIGAGAVGGVLGGRLAEAGHDVVLVARGAQYEALRAGGLRLVTPDGPSTRPIPVVDRPEALELTADDVLVLAVKTQDSTAALDAWSVRPVAGGSTAGERLPLICAQNGVESERLALRRFRRVYGMCVWLPATFVEPGEVLAAGTPLTGVLHLGRYPAGTDETARLIAADLEKSKLLAPVVHDVMRWKYGKLLSNLANAIEAVTGPLTGQGASALLERALAEGRAVLAAAGIDPVSQEDQAAARAGLRFEPFDGSLAAAARPGRASAGAPARSKPTTSTARSCCSAASTAYPRPSTTYFAAPRTRSRASAGSPARCPWPNWSHSSTPPPEATGPAVVAFLQYRCQWPVLVWDA